MSASDTHPDRFNLSVPLSPAVSIMLATQFTRDGLVGTLATYMTTPEPGFVISGEEPAQAVAFLAGLKRDRLELHGPGDSALILDILGLLAAFDDVDQLMSDVGNFANEELKSRWYNLLDRDPVTIEREIRELACRASKLFERACRP
jgi:hypothetical protein